MCAALNEVWHKKAKVKQLLKSDRKATPTSFSIKWCVRLQKGLFKSESVDVRALKMFVVLEKSSKSKHC